ncbi:stage II sporulation protein AA (anti-sigma F factor antagonist) [Clostridium tertium]|nr:stage II sporulation protein AA (anti-sigma F factor antagonist) [Clostridium tertium]
MGALKEDFRVVCMYLKFDKKEDKLVVSLMGELDHHSAEEVRVKIDDRIDRDNIKKVILNFNGVTFMDSSGIGVVIGRFKKMQNRDGKLCVAEINRTVNKVFEISGMYKIIDVYSSIDEAVVNI